MEKEALSLGERIFTLTKKDSFSYRKNRYGERRYQKGKCTEKAGQSESARLGTGNRHMQKPEESPFGKERKRKKKANRQLEDDCPSRERW